MTAPAREPELRVVVEDLRPARVRVAFGQLAQLAPQERAAHVIFPHEALQLLDRPFQQCELVLQLPLFEPRQLREAHGQDGSRLTIGEPELLA